MPSYMRRGDTTDTVVVRLTQKLASAIDGIDLTGYEIGEIITLPARSARLLLAEGWAEAIDEERRRRPPTQLQSAAADGSQRKRRRRRS
jgi:hypothetical protein